MFLKYGKSFIINDGEINRKPRSHFFIELKP